MATIKSYTDISQSKKLAEILPIESADMHYAGHQSIINPKEWEYEAMPNIRGKYISFDDKRIFYPCWSLAALLGVLLNGTNIIKDEADTENEKYMCTVGVKNDILSTFSDNPVDACVAMIEKLHELKML